MDEILASMDQAPPPDRYRVIARVKAPGVATGTAKDREVEFDASRTGSSDLPGPAELLALSFAACLLKNVERFSHLLSFDYDGASVIIDAERQDSPPRFTTIRYELRINTCEDAHRVELLHRNLRRYGTVYNTLAATCDVDGTLVAGPDVTEAFPKARPDPLMASRCC